MISESVVYAILSGIALLFATSWTITNFYNYYPFIQSKVIGVVTGKRTADAAFIRETIDGVEELPVIDVYVPAYQEGSVIHQSITSIRETAYPGHKLRLHVVLEPDDDDTRSAVNDLLEEYTFNVITVPKKYPGTPNKPRALNYAFEKTDGEIVGIIDAENIVDEQLFDRVAAAFIDSDLDYLQGQVDMVNEDDGWLNLLFRAEYGYWYRLIVPAFQRIGFPIPLSGTTCFFRRSLLHRASDLRYERTGAPWDGEGERFLSRNGFDGYIPWDPSNVTEDFELGLLLWASEYNFGLIDVVTYEESPTSFSNWIEQRTRWQKGKLYTFVQFFRNPVDSKDKMSHLLWQSFIPHLGPLNILAVITLVLIGWVVGFVPELILVVSVLILSLVFLVFGVLSFVGGYWSASTKPAGARLGRSVIVSVTLPLYWLLQWIADVKAIKKLLMNDLDWERTVHKDHARFDEIRALDDKHSTSLQNLVKRHLRRDIWLYPVLVIALLVRLPDMTRSLWLDEIYSVQVRGSMSFFGTLIVNDVHPPLYYLALNGWMTVFGNSVIAVRSFSIVIGLAVIAATYALATRLYDRQTGLLSTLFIALLALHVQAAQEVRMYSMLVLFSVLSLYFYVRLWEVNTMDNRFGYGLCTLCMLLTHSYGWFVLFAQCAHVGISVRKQGSVDVAKQWVRYQAPVYIFALPVIILIVFRNFIAGQETETVDWLTQPGLPILRDIVLSYGGVPTTYPKVMLTESTTSSGFVILIIFALSLAFLVYRQGMGDSSNEHVTLLMLVLLSVVGIPYIVSIVAFPMLEVRYAIIGSIPFAILLARGIRIIDQQTVKLALVAIIVLLLTVNLVSFYQASTSEDWEGLGQTLSDEDLSNDLIIFSPDYTEDSAFYYMGDESKETVDTVMYEDDRNLQQSLQSDDYDRVWIAVRGEAEEEILQILIAHGYQHDSTESFGDIELIEYHYSATEEESE